jgi:hypothetical protein
MIRSPSRNKKEQKNQKKCRRKAKRGVRNLLRLLIKNTRIISRIFLPGRGQGKNTENLAELHRKR